MGENKVVNPMYETLGQRLKRLREAKGLNPNRLGKNTRVDPGYIARIEKGEIKNPGWEVVLKLAEGLDVSLQYIYTGKDAEPVTSTAVMTTDDNDLKLLANIFTKHSNQEFLNNSHAPLSSSLSVDYSPLALYLPFLAG